MTPANGVVIVSAYNPTVRLVGLVAGLVRQCRVIVVDDGSGPDSDGVLEQVEEEGADLIRLGRNLGIASALNAGAERAFAAGAEWIVTFDQDSRPPTDYIDRVLASAVSAAARGIPVGALVPGKFSDVPQGYGRVVAPGLRKARRVIQSGMFVPESAWKNVGTLRDDLFIDLVDTEYELRLEAAGRDVLAVDGLTLPHSLGSSLQLVPFGHPPLDRLTFTTMVSTPFRYYYRVRNRVVLTRAHVRRFPGRLLRDFVQDFVYFAALSLCARPRKVFLALVVRGVSDGMRGRLGPIPAELMEQSRSLTWSVKAARSGGVRQ